jgi:hypothetical protein
VFEKKVQRREFAPNRERINKRSFGEKILDEERHSFPLQNTGFPL